MPQPPVLTAEQRTAALAKAAQARKARAEIKDHLKTGRVTLKDLLGKADGDDTVGKMKVLAVLEALPGTGKVKARRLMEVVGISETRRLQGLGTKQRDALLEAVERPLILVVSGPGGAGKGTVIRRLIEADPRLWLSRSWTTRPRRPQEPEDAYTFVDRDTFIEKAEAGGFLEWATILDDYYGTPLPEPTEGKDVVLEIDVQGAEQVRRNCKDVVCVLLLPPSLDEQAARLRGRGDAETHVERRLSLGEQEVARATAFADVVVVNDDVEEAVAELQGIVEDARRKAAH